MIEQRQVLERQSLLAMAQFVPLIWSAMRHANMNSSELSRKSGISKTKLSRSLSGRTALDLATIQQVFLALGIDTQRALLAIGRLGDWHRYYDPDIEILSGLLDRLPDTIAAARDGGERAAISPAGINRLADHISAVIADHDRKVSERRRDEFMWESNLRHAG